MKLSAMLFSFLVVFFSTASFADNEISWLTDRLYWEVCQGKPFASENLFDEVMVKDPGVTLPVPDVEFHMEGAPAWLAGKSDFDEAGIPTFVLAGTPTGVEKKAFKVRAFFRGYSEPINAYLSVVSCVP